MSTIRRLDPTIRRSRRDRRDVVRSLQRVLPRIPMLLGRLTGAATWVTLEDIRCNPRLTGGTKATLFTSIINKLQEGNSPTGQQEAA